MHFSINAHAVQGFSLKQVRACLRLEPLSLKLNGSRCGLAYGLPCGLLYVLLYGFLYGLLCGLLCGLLYSLLRELLYGLLCSVRHAFPLLLPLTSVFNTDSHQEQAHAHRSGRPSVCAVAKRNTL